MHQSDGGKGLGAAVYGQPQGDTRSRAGTERGEEATARDCVPISNLKNDSDSKTQSEGDFARMQIPRSHVFRAASRRQGDAVRHDGAWTNRALVCLTRGFGHVTSLDARSAKHSMASMNVDKPDVHTYLATAASSSPSTLHPYFEKFRSQYDRRLVAPDR